MADPRVVTPIRFATYRTDGSVDMTCNEDIVRFRRLLRPRLSASTGAKGQGAALRLITMVSSRIRSCQMARRTPLIWALRKSTWIHWTSHCGGSRAPYQPWTDGDRSRLPAERGLSIDMTLDVHNNLSLHLRKIFEYNQCDSRVVYLTVRL
jgi:hypothetical protein